MIGDVVRGAAQRDLPYGPRGVVGEVGGQDADPQLPLSRQPPLVSQGGRDPPKTPPSPPVPTCRLK